MTPLPADVSDYAPPARPAAPAWAKAAAAGVVAVLVWLSYHGVRKPDAQLSDFGAYYRAGQAVAAGRSPYTIDPAFGPTGAYMYCPAFAEVVCRPLAALPYVWAMRAFVTVNWAATVGVVALSLRLLTPSPGTPGEGRGEGLRVSTAVGMARPEDPHPNPLPAYRERGPDKFWIGLIACCSAGEYLRADLHNGQVGTLLVLACLGWVVLTLAGRPAAGGVCLSLAVGLKLYPMLLGPFLLLRRRWWPGLIGLGLGLAVQFAVPVVTVGGRGLLPLHREWIHFCFRTQVVGQTIRTGNQSLLGVLARLPGITDGVHVFSPARLIAVQRVYPGIVLVGTLAAYGWIVVRRVDPARAVAVLLVWMTVAAPRAWTFNFAAELPAAVLLAAAVLDRPRWWLIVALVAPVYAVTFPTNWLPPPTRWAAGPQFLYDKHFVAAAVLVAAVAGLGHAGSSSRV